MKLLSIEVEGWRCFLRPVRVDGFVDGLNVIHAPNGSGKSKLFEALHYAMHESHSVRRQEIAAVIPWGRRLAPRVCVEFSAQGVNYRIRKQFVDSPFSYLDRAETGSYLPIAQGSSVDEFLGQMLSCQPRGRKADSAEFWGIAQVLWAPQGELRLTTLSESLSANIRETLSAQLEGTVGLKARRRIEELYATHYTATGKLRSGKVAPPVVQLEARLGDAQQAVAAAQATLEDFEGTAQSVASLRQSWTQMQSSMAEQQQEIVRLKRTATEELAHAAERDAEASRVSALADRLSTVRAGASQVFTQRQRVESQQSEFQSLQAGLFREEQEYASAEAQEGDARDHQQSARQALSALASRRREAGDAVLLCDADREVKRLLARQGRVNAAAEAMAEAAVQLEKLRAPTPTELAAIRSAILRRHEAGLRLEASLLHLEITPHRDGEITVHTAGKAMDRQPFVSGVPVTLQGVADISADLSGLAALHVWGPTGSAEEYRAALDSAEASLRSLTAVYETDDLGLLERLSQERIDLERRCAEALSLRDSLLDGDTEPMLKEQVASAQGVLAELLGRHPEWHTSLPDAASMAREIESAEAKAQSALALAEERCDLATAAANGARTRLATQRALATRLQAALDTDRQLLAELEGQLGSLDHLNEEHRRLAAELDSARKRLGEAERVLQASSTGAVQRVELLEEQLALSEQDAEQIHTALIQEETRLESLASLAPYARLAQAEEAREHLRSEWEQETVRSSAIKLLYDTYQVERSRAFESVVGGVEKSATAYLTHIAGPTLGRVQLGGAFALTGVVPARNPEVVGPEQLSGGEAEQLYFATRLALAHVLAQSERQMVVLDDVLTATDQQRFGRILELLEQAAERLQVIILTCHEERYRALSGARFIDLAALVTG